MIVNVGLTTVISLPVRLNLKIKITIFNIMNLLIPNHIILDCFSAAPRRELLSNLSSPHVYRMLLDKRATPAATWTVVVRAGER